MTIPPVAVIKDLWREINKQAIPDSGIHLSVQLIPDSSLENVEACVVVEVWRDNKLYSLAERFNFGHPCPRQAVKNMTRIGYLTKIVSREELEKHEEDIGSLGTT